MTTVKKSEPRKKINRETETLNGRRMTAFLQKGLSVHVISLYLKRPNFLVWFGGFVGILAPVRRLYMEFQLGEGLKLIFGQNWHEMGRRIRWNPLLGVFFFFTAAGRRPDRRLGGGDKARCTSMDWHRKTAL